MQPGAESPSVFSSPSLFLVLRHSGLSIWTGEDPPPLPVERPELLVLEELASGLDGRGELVRRAGVAATRLEGFIDDLRRRDLLSTAPTGSGAIEPVGGLQPLPSGAMVSEVGPADALDDVALMAEMPTVIGVSGTGFEILDHFGTVRARLGAVEVGALAEFRAPKTPREAFDGHQAAEGDLSLSDDDFHGLVDGLRRSRLLVPARPGEGGGREGRDARHIYRSFMRMSRATDEAVASHEERERAREAGGAKPRVRVTPLDHRAFPAPLSLGMVIAYARAYEEGALDEHYQFVPAWISRQDRMSEVPEEPGIYLCSNYIWSHGQNLSMSAAVKERSPFSLIVHGGPDTPKYEGDVAKYLMENPQVDVAVHGEGEATFAELLEALIGAFDGDGPPDLSPLADVAGISFRDGERIVHTSPRDRLTDLDVIPSPFLTGVFDVHAEAGFSLAIIETNRGCPYGCTFCDWGSATLARIRKFDLSRVFAELEWCAQHQVERIFVADANFGIFSRDVEIAQKVADMKAEYGYPKLFSTNYAKNTTKHLRTIVETLGRAGILTQGLLSLQTMDTDTLTTIKRSNIKVEKYDDLAREFRKADLPLFVDLMLGLPGATVTSFRADLQQCIDREITAKVYPTELLVNSPMNEPAYREHNEIQTSAPLGALAQESREPDGSTRRALLVSTSTYTKSEYAEMLDLRRAVTMAENFGVMRQISRFVRQETGLLEIDLYDRLRAEAREHPDRSPALAFTLHVGPFLGCPPVSWALFIDELHRFVTLDVGVDEDSSLTTVLAVQHALLPTPGRAFPLTLELAHDYSSWHRTMVDLKDNGHRDWTERMPRLRDFGPAPFTVDDPHEVCQRALGYEIETNLHGSWELQSTVARAVSHEHQWDE